jgi:DNA-binding transcriptional LysR family regulator
MDIELLRTFLEVERARHFGKAAERLCITQSAVSVRIRNLEESLGTPVLLRQRNNLQLTPAGQRLKKHAETIVHAWVRARQETGLQPEYTGGLAVGAMWDLWLILLDTWLITVRRTFPDTVLQIESGTAEVLVQRLLDGVLDLAFLFEPPRVQDIEIREVAVINLVLASTRRDHTVADALSEGYILVDWGTAFSLSHARFFPDMPAPAIRMNLGILALQHLQRTEGAAYLAERMLQSAAGKHRLHQVREAPRIERRAFAIFRPDSDRDTTIREALNLLGDV